MTEEAKKVRSAYMKAWRKAHPDRVRESNRRYWEKKAMQQQETKREQKKEEQL